MRFSNRLLMASDKYLKKCKWTDIALLKFCLCAIGIVIGLGIAKENRKCVRTAAILVFMATYIPLMSKFLPILIDEFTDLDV